MISFLIFFVLGVSLLFAFAAVWAVKYLDELQDRMDGDIWRE